MPHENPIKPRELWAYEDRGRFWYASAYRRFVSACAGDTATGIVRVLATEDRDGQYYGWLDFRDDELDHIWPSEGQRDMCFPYGPAEEETRRRGRRVRLRLELK